MANQWKELSKKPMFNLIKLIFVFVISGVLFYFSLRAAALLMPFVLALLGAMAMEPIIRRLCKIGVKGHYVPRSVASIATMLVMGVIVGVALTFLIDQIITQLVSLATSVPAWINEFSAQLKVFAAWVEEKIDILPEDLTMSITGEISTLLSTAVRQLSTVVNPLARGVWTTAQRIPVILLSIIMWLVGTYYMCSMRPRMSGFMRESLPQEWMDRIVNVKNRLFSTLFGYIRAQLLLMLAVFAIIFIGLTILRVEYALVIAMIIALFDALPVIGSGLFLNSWAVYSLVTGNVPLAIGLFLIYIAVLIGRNVLEPRLVSVQIGLPSLLTMAAMYAGFRLFGFVGLIGGPILVVVLRIVYEYYAHGRTLREVLNGTEVGSGSSKADKAPESI